MEDLDCLDIVAAGPMEENSKWLVTLRSKEAGVKALGMAQNIVTCRIHWLPSFVPMASTVVFLSRYGVVHSANWDYSKLEDFTHVRSTVRATVLELDDGCNSPSIDRLMYQDEVYKFLIPIPGRDLVCFCCQAVGHMRQDCPTPYCRHCSKVGHFS